MRSAPRLALLFDLDGTLVDSLDLILTCFRHAFRTHVGVVPSDDDLVAGIGTPLIAQISSFVESAETRQAIVTTYRAYQMEHHDRLIREFDGAREVLHALHERGHPMAIVTSKAELLAERALEFAGLAEYMDAVIGVESCQRHKPDPEPVHVALRALDARARDALFVGDSPHDITSGNAAGVTTVAALWGPFTRETLAAARPRHFIAHIRELPPLVTVLERR
jgi:pyrophosphatase PpaX